jgi:hypothetical protein
MRAILCLLLPLLVTSADPDAVIDSVFRRQDVLDGQYNCAQYKSRLRYIESDLKSGDVKLVECERVVTIPRCGEQVHDFGPVWVDGQPVEGSRRDDEIESLMSKGKHARKTLMPFFPQTRDEYEYAVVGRDTWRGMQVWQVEFTPKRETGRHITGSALVLDSAFDIVSMEFMPSDLPFVVTDARMELDYDFFDGRWLPVRFKMDMDLRLAFIIELMRRHVLMEETYWDHSFTNTAPVGAEDGE